MKEAIVSGRIDQQRLAKMRKFCNQNDRTPSWVVGKALEEFFAKRNGGLKNERGVVSKSRTGRTRTKRKKD